MLGPVWACETVGGATSTHAYVRNADGTITLHNDIRIGAQTYPIVETYRFDREHARWVTAVQRGGYYGTAPEWLGQKWIFDGVESANGHKSPVRMVYTKLGDQAFRRDFQLLDSGGTRTLESETCQRQ